MLRVLIGTERAATFHRAFSLVVAYFTMVVAGGAHGATNQMSLRQESVIVDIEGFSSGNSISFWQQFERSFDKRAEEVFADQMHPVTVMGWQLKKPGESWENFLERANGSAQSGFMKSVEYSLRDAAAVLPLIGGFESDQDSFGDLLMDSLDAVEEESVSPLDPAYRSTERLWWQSLAEKRMLRYGVRPLGTDPYAFLSLRVQEADQLILMGHVRYYFRNFADHRFELALSVPLAHGFALDVGTAYQFGPHDEEKKLVLKLFKPLRGGGIVHVGIELQKSPTLFAAISLPM